MDSPHILVVEDDPDTASLLEEALTSSGFRVSLASTGQRALDRMREEVPTLVLLDQLLPDFTGIEVCQRLRREPGAGAVPVVMLTALGRDSDQVAGLEAGADDYIVKPFSVDTLIARLRSHVRRSRRERQLNPLTGMPGNLAIDQEIEDRLDTREPFAVAWVDIDHFKAYNDRYGFFAGDQVIERTGRLLCEALDEVCPSNCFAGHIGGDDFVLIMPVTQMERIGRSVVERFDAAVTGWYSAEDRARGFVSAVARTGDERQFPLMSISVAIVPCPPGRFSHLAEIAEVAAEIKHYLKQQPGSGWLINRRGPEPPASTPSPEAD